MSESPMGMRQAFPFPLRPEALIGAASPLWAYFTIPVMAGITWWWMTRLMRPAHLEAMFGAAARPIPIDLPGEALAEALTDDQWAILPVGGESAPFGVATLEAEILSQPEIAADLLSTETKQPAPPAEAREAARKEPRTGPRKPRAEGEPKPH